MQETATQDEALQDAHDAERNDEAIQGGCDAGGDAGERGEEGDKMQWGGSPPSRLRLSHRPIRKLGLRSQPYRSRILCLSQSVNPTLLQTLLRLHNRQFYLHLTDRLPKPHLHLRSRYTEH
jgi:hypothetical protein